MRLDLQQGRLRGLALDDRGRLRLSTGRDSGPREGEWMTPALRLDSARAAVRWVAQWTAPQRWRKHPANPIFGPSQTGAWDDWTNGVSIVPFDQDRRYRMYYCGKTGGIGFAEADVDDPLTWREHPASPVLTPRPDTWEGTRLNQPRVVKVSEDHWRMYYTGWGLRGAPGTSWALGLAESFDGGVTWARYQDEPILERGGPDAPDGGAAVVPHLLRDHGRWMMWYTAGRLNPAGHQNIHLCLATSEDGLHFTKHPGNPVLSDDFTDGAPRSVTSRCFVRREQGVFQMWYSFAKPDYRIHYAESLDGVQWERSPVQPVLGPSPAPAWDDQMVEYPEVQRVGEQWRLWFCGNGFGRVGYATGEPETALAVELRAGDSAEPGAGWSDWRETSCGSAVAAGPWVQVRVRMRSEDPRLSPTLNELTVEPA